MKGSKLFNRFFSITLTMKTFQIISKNHCPRCTQLKEWIKDQDLPFEEWHIEDDPVTQKLMNDPELTQTFCDIDGCMVYTPVIRIEETGKYYFKQLFNQMGIREKFVKDLLEI